MICLIGLGFEFKDLNLKGIEEMRKCERVYIEFYTGKWMGRLEELEKLIGKKIEVLERKDLEENSEKIIEEAKKKNICLLIEGDPLVSTTHSSLVLECKKKGIDTKIIHNISIISAISEVGLHLQKFGPFVTIPFKEKVNFAESVYEVIKMNRNRGLHTLCLLDIEKNKVMKVKEGIKILKELEEKRKEGVIKDNLKVVVILNLGIENQEIIFKSLKELENFENEGQACLIIPGSLHFTEKEFLNILNI